MIKDITLGQYMHGNSLIHRADSRVKMILVMVFSILIFFIQSYISFIITFLIIVMAKKCINISIKYILKGMKPILPIVIFSVLIKFITTEGESLFQFMILKVTLEGVILGVKMGIRLVLLFTVASFLTLTTTPIELTDGIEKLLSPLKKIRVPVHEFAMSTTIAIRFIPILIEETDKLIKAQSSRGVNFESGKLSERVKNFMPILIPIFIGIFKRAEELAVAMEARCYRGAEGRTKMKEIRIKKVDIQLISIFFTYLIILYFTNLYIKKLTGGIGCII